MSLELIKEIANCLDEVVRQYVEDTLRLKFAEIDPKKSLKDQEWKKHLALTEVIEKIEDIAPEVYDPHIEGYSVQEFVKKISVGL
jgi:hypothetical protein